MAHMIARTNGKHAAVYAFQPAWHGLGTVLDHVIDPVELDQEAEEFDASLDA